jgi:hypothetical protein
MFNKPTSEATLLNKSSCLAPELVVTKCIIVKNMFLVEVRLKSDLDVQQAHLWAPGLQSLVDWQILFVIIHAVVEFNTHSHFYPSLISTSKSRSLPSGCSSISDSPWEGSSITCLNWGKSVCLCQTLQLTIGWKKHCGAMPCCRRN